MRGVVIGAALDLARGLLSPSAIDGFLVTRVTARPLIRRFATFSRKGRRGSHRDLLHDMYL